MWVGFDAFSRHFSREFGVTAFRLLKTDHVGVLVLEIVQAAIFQPRPESGNVPRGYLNEIMEDLI